LKEFNNLKYGKTCVFISKKADSSPADVRQFAYKISKEIIAVEKNLTNEALFIFRDKKVSVSDIKKILLKE
jgi:hypothetical protein